MTKLLLFLSGLTVSFLSKIRNPSHLLILSGVTAIFLSKIRYLSPGEDVVDGKLTTSFEYTVEIVCVSFLVIFGINYFIGKLQNEKLALAWATKFATKDSIFDKNFSLLGVGETEGLPLLLKEGQAVFKFYASGRRYCQGLLATMELKSRHDLISRIYNMMVPCRDEISFEVYMNDDAMDNVVFAVAEKKAAKAMQKEERDLHKFATMVSQPYGRKWVAEELRVVSESKEVAGDLITEAVLDLVFGDKAFEEFGEGFISMHFSDQHIGPQRKMLLFKFALPDANNMADMTRLVALVLYYIDLIGLYKLNPQARSKTEAARTKAAQEVYKELQHTRQEALQNKKAMIKRLIKDAEAKLIAEAIRKRKAKERAYQTKAMLKMKMTRAYTNEAEIMNLLEEDLKTKATESVGTGIRTTSSISTPERLSIQHASDDEKLKSLMVSFLKFGWERLEDDTTRNCFRNFAVHSKEQEQGIEGSALIQRWISNGLIGTHEKGKQIIKALTDVNLLESDDVSVKIGDVAKHVFVNLIIQPEECRLFLMCSGLGLTESPKDEEWENAKEIHLQENEFSVLPQNPSCSVLSALFLQRNKKLRTIPPLFFAGMQALQVLNLSRTRVKSLPESLFNLANLKRLYLSYCDHLRALPPKIGDLRQLEVLDMEGTEILTLPEEFKSLTALQCLEVSFYKGRRSEPMIPRGIISALIRLEELNITVHPDDEGWDSCVGAIATEVFSLPRLSTLKLFFPRVELLRSLHSPSLSHFRITVGHHVSRIMSRIPTDVEFEAERWERCFRYVNGVHVLGDIQRLLQRAAFFHLDRHATIEKLSEFGIGNMEELKCCVLVECNELQVIVKGEEEETRDEIVSVSEDNDRAALGSLEYLYVFHMKNLKKIREGPVQKCFLALKFLNLHTCPRLTTIFAREWIDDLCSLEELIVRDCPAVLSIVSCGDDPLKHDTSCFLPRLKRMSLCYMPGLVCISGGLYIAPRLECVSFYDCPNLETLLRDEEMSSNDLKKIKGEKSWWEALEWIGGKPNHINDIFVPIHGCDL